MRRRLYFLVIGLISFIAVNVSTALPYQTFGGHSWQAIEYPEGSKSSPEDRRISQLPSLGNDTLDDLAWGFITNELLKAIDGGIPIVPNTRKTFPTVNVLPGEPFEASVLPQTDWSSASLKHNGKDDIETSRLLGQLPRVRNQNRSPEELPDYGAATISEGDIPFSPSSNPGYITAQLHNSSDGTVMLAPGDYEIPVTMFCMNQSASSPPGHRYVLAPLQGSRAPAVAALNARASGLNLEYKPLQELSWNIQAGVAYDEMPAASQVLVEQLIPDYRDQLRGSFLDDIENTYNTISGFTNLPSFNSALSQLGRAGQIIREYQQFRNTLQRYQNNYSQLFSTLIPASRTTSAIGGADRTPWSQLDDRVYARMITEASAGGQGKLQMRVLSVRTPAGIIQSLVQVAITNIIADSETENTQSITGVPQTPAEEAPTEVATTPPDSSETDTNEQNNDDVDEQNDGGQPFEKDKPGRPQVINEDTDMTNTDTWPVPPVDGSLTEGEPSRKKPRERGESSLYDENGGEWRPAKPDQYHDPHWDYKAPGNNTPWENLDLNGDPID